MEKFISCDWGTSNFRLRLISIPELRVLAETETGEGIAATYKSWKASCEEREIFYKRVLLKHISNLENQSDFSLQNCDIVISGMASSSIGLKELPYKHCPVVYNGGDFIIEFIKANNEFPYNLHIISGIRTIDDVMRGEETILAGLDLNNNTGNQVFILPGTHSKHVLIKDGKIWNIKTYMTGEIFHLLSTQSILAGSVENKSTANESSFDAGVLQSFKSSLLHNAFLVRTNHLLKKIDGADNYNFLSGLLIGSELVDLPNKNNLPVNIISNSNLGNKYVKAAQILGFKNTNFYQAEHLLIKGQAKIYRNCLEKEIKKSS